MLEGGGQNGLSMYYINICSDLIHSNQAARCKSDSSVCLLGNKTLYRWYNRICGRIIVSHIVHDHCMIVSDNSGAHSLGRYLQNPTFDPRSNTIQITYTEGDLCRDNTQKKSSIVTFICKPGTLPPPGNICLWIVFFFFYLPFTLCYVVHCTFFACLSILIWWHTCRISVMLSLGSEFEITQLIG